jgi:hypothetical protein
LPTVLALVSETLGGCVRAEGQGHPHIPIVRDPERDENGPEGGPGFAKQDGPPADRTQRRPDRQVRTHQAGKDPARARGHELYAEDSQAAAPVLSTDQGRDERLIPAPTPRVYGRARG